MLSEERTFSQEMKELSSGTGILHLGNLLTEINVELELDLGESCG